MQIFRADLLQRWPRNTRHISANRGFASATILVLMEGAVLLVEVAPMEAFFKWAFACNAPTIRPTACCCGV